MKGTLSNFTLFAAGALVGSVVTWKILKTKYDQLIQEEVASVKDALSKRKSMLQTLKNVDEMHDVKDERYEKIASRYTSDNGKEESESMSEPYVIEPDNFGMADYETVTLTYYSDGVVADESDDIVEDVEGMIGFESLNHFGEYEDDSVYVRNDGTKTDYEILRDYRTYTDVTGMSYPTPVEE